MTRDQLIDAIEFAASRVNRSESGSNERARAFVAQLSGALEHDHPDVAKEVFALVEEKN